MDFDSPREWKNRHEQMCWEHAIRQYEHAKASLARTQNPRLKEWYEKHMADIRARYPNVRFD